MTSSGLEALSLGDSAVTIRFGTEKTPELLARVHAAAATITRKKIDGVEDVVPAYLAVTVFYDSLSRTYADIAAQLLKVCESVGERAEDAAGAREHVIRTRYDGIDLESVATSTGLSTEEVIQRHTARTYRVDLLGFVPGFGYMSELDKSLYLPRRPQPRPRVASGSVAIAALQTAVYPLETPGGWHIIGTTDVVMFDPTRTEPALLRAGDTVRFERAE
jgi:KipI family sensor histidine kinase inhibitor